MIDILHMAKTVAVVRMHFGVLNHTEIEVLIGGFKLMDTDTFGRYKFRLDGESLSPPLTRLDIFDQVTAYSTLDKEWTRGGGSRRDLPSDNRWLKVKDFIACEVGENGLNGGVVGPYHPTCQQLVAILILQMSHDLAKASNDDEKKFYQTAMSRLRSLSNKVNERQAEVGAYPKLLFSTIPKY